MKLDRVSISFDEQVVLRDFNLALTPGSITCLMGPSGCGKTTVLRLMLGFLKPDSGSITGFSTLKTGVVFQEDRLVGHLNAEGNVRLVTGTNASAEKISLAMAELGLDALSGPVSALSGGERRRVALLRAVLYHPQLLLLDEPFKGLDDANRARAASFVRSSLDGATVLLITHDREDALRLGADRIVIMEKHSSVSPGIKTADPGTACGANPSER